MTDARPARARRPARPSGDDRERDILATLERLLETTPLHALSVDDLARGAGISRPTFYFYFASKEAVLLTLLERMLDRARRDRDARLARLVEGDRAGWREAIASAYEVFRDSRAVTLAATEARATSDEVRALWSRATQQWVDETAAAIEAERDRGAAPPGPPPAALATSLVLMNESVLHATFAGHSPAVAEGEVLDVLLAVWLAAVYGSPGVQDGPGPGAGRSPGSPG